MSEIIDALSSKIFDSFKKITPALMAVAILTGLLLFLPVSVLEKMGLNDLPVLWTRIIGIAFLLSVALIGTIMLSSVFSFFFTKMRNRQTKERLRKSLKTLSPNQKEIIKCLLKSEDKAILLDRNTGDTMFLENGSFIYLPQQAFTLGLDNKMLFTYVPQPWLIELYNEEPALFE